jgi:hypothetical protein
MEMKDKNTTWQTNDFYSAVLVRASGIPLLNLISGNGKFLTFQFSASPDMCEEIIKKHWDRTLKVESRLLIETINELKTRIHEKSKGAHEQG